MNDIEDRSGKDALDLEVDEEECCIELWERFYQCQNLKSIASAIKFSEHMALSTIRCVITLWNESYHGNFKLKPILLRQ